MPDSTAASKMSTVFSWITNSLLLLLYLVTCFAAALPLFFVLPKAVYSAQSPALWAIFVLSLLTFALVTWQFFDAFLKGSRINMLQSLVSISGVSWAADTERIKLTLISDVNTYGDLVKSVKLGFMEFSSTEPAITTMALFFPLGALAILVSRVREAQGRQAPANPNDHPPAKSGEGAPVA
jgi:hypothetical protein